MRPRSTWSIVNDDADDEMVSAGTDGVIKLTDLSGEEIPVLREKPNLSVNAVALSLDVRLLAAATVQRQEPWRRYRSNQSRPKSPTGLTAASAVPGLQRGSCSRVLVISEYPSTRRQL